MIVQLVVEQCRTQQQNKKREKLATTSEEAITVSLFLSYRISALTHDNTHYTYTFLDTLHHDSSTILKLV